MRVSTPSFKLASLAVLTVLAACGGGRYHGPTAYDLHGQRGAMRPGGDYIVRPGDTLFGISWRYGLDMQELANWNGISDPNRILVGQRLRTTPPRGVQPKPVYIPQVSSAGQPGWMWPTRGRVISEYSPNTPGGQSLKIGRLRLPRQHQRQRTPARPARPTNRQHGHQPAKRPGAVLRNPQRQPHRQPVQLHRQHPALLTEPTA